MRKDQERYMCTKVASHLDDLAILVLFRDVKSLEQLSQQLLGSGERLVGQHERLHEIGISCVREVL